PVSQLRGDAPTGEPDAGEPPVRFGGRGKQTQLFLPTPISRSTNRDSSITRVSIHAPARGRDRTAGSYGGRPAYEVSIHAPARGRDLQREGDHVGHRMFQSTLPRVGATGDGWRRASIYSGYIQAT